MKAQRDRMVLVAILMTMVGVYLGGAYLIGTIVVDTMVLFAVRTGGPFP